MSKKRSCIEVLGLSLMAVFAVMAMSATAAQAGEFRVGGKTFKAAGIKSEAAVGTGGPSTISIPSSGLALQCGGTVHEVKTALLPEGTIDHDLVTKLGCSASSKGVPIKGCTIYPTEADREEGTNAGQISEADKGSLVLNAGAHYMVFKSLELTIYIDGALCPLSEEMMLSGSYALSMPNALTELVKQTVAPVSKEVASALKVELVLGGEPAFLTGESRAVELSGPNKGKTWGAE